MLWNKLTFPLLHYSLAKELFFSLCVKVVVSQGSFGWQIRFLKRLRTMTSRSLFSLPLPPDDFSHSLKVSCFIKKLLQYFLSPEKQNNFRQAALSFVLQHQTFHWRKSNNSLPCSRSLFHCTTKGRKIIQYQHEGREYGDKFWETSKVKTSLSVSLVPVTSNWLEW